MLWVGCSVILILSFRLGVGAWFGCALADWLLLESSACWLDLCAVGGWFMGLLVFWWVSGWVWYCLGFAGFGGSFGLGVFAVLVWVC